jgi:hypothetical protein
LSSMRSALLSACGDSPERGGWREREGKGGEDGVVERLRGLAGEREGERARERERARGGEDGWRTERGREGGRRERDLIALLSTRGDSPEGGRVWGCV